MSAMEEFNLDRHHAGITAVYSYNPVVSTPTWDWIMLLQFGVRELGLRFTDKRIRWAQKLAERKSSSTTWMLEALASTGSLPNMHHLLNRPDATVALYKAWGLTFDNVQAVVTEFSTVSPLVSPYGCEKPNQGYFSANRAVYNAKCFMILHGSVPREKALAFIQGLPGHAQFIRLSLTQHEEGGVLHDCGLFVKLFHESWPV